jgi:DNA-binding response OmpR family regulator
MTSARILFVEDDINLGFVTKDTLQAAGFVVTHCSTAPQARETFAPGRFEICVLDVMLQPYPATQTDGFELARYIRQHDPNIPILFLSARADATDRLQGLRLGADDYLTKPFSIEELILKIRVFLRRSTAISAAAPGPDPGFLFNRGNLSLAVNGQPPQTLTQREADVLACLLAHPNELVRRDDLLLAVWGNTDYFMGRSLDVFISRLRKRLAGAELVKIENLHGVGFRLVMAESPTFTA